MTVDFPKTAIFMVADPSPVHVQETFDDVITQMRDAVAAYENPGLVHSVFLLLNTADPSKQDNRVFINLAHVAVIVPATLTDKPRKAKS